MNFWDFLDNNFVWIFLILIIGVGAYFQHVESMAKIQKDTPKVEQPVK